MSTERRMDKEVVVRVHSGILLSHKKELVNADEVEEPRTYYTERSGSEKDKYHILMYIYRI